MTAVMSMFSSLRQTLRCSSHLSNRNLTFSRAEGGGAACSKYGFVVPGWLINQHKVLFTFSLKTSEYRKEAYAFFVSLAIVCNSSFIPSSHCDRVSRID